MFEGHKSRESNNSYSMSESEAQIYGVVQNFRKDPVSILEELKANILDEDPESNTVVLKAVDEIEVIYDSAKDIQEAVNEAIDAEAQGFLSAEKDSLEYYSILIQLLHQASYSYEEVLTWAKIESDTQEPEEVLADKGLRAILNKVYGKT